MTLHTFRSLASGLLLLSSLAHAAPPGRMVPQTPIGLPEAGTRLTQQPWPGAERVERDANGSVVWAEGKLGSAGLVQEAAVWRLLEELGPRLGLTTPRRELALDEIVRDEIGMHHARFRRVHDGVPVAEADLVLHFESDGTLAVVNGRYPPSLRLAPVAWSVDEAALVARAMQTARLEARRRGEETPKELASPPRTRRVVWPEPARHALEIEVDFAPHQRWRIYVDLARGVPLAVRNRVHSDSPQVGAGTDSLGQRRTLHLTYFNQQQVYGTLDSTNTNGGAIATLNANYQQTFQAGLFASRTTEVADPAAVDVHANMRLVADYYRNTHGRASWDGQGADVVSLVHFGRSYANAFWNGDVMAFGDGDGQTLVKPHRCLDIAAHELTHAVIERTVGLVYENQSGALNEHFADVFGALVDTADWNIGEKCAGPRLGRAFLRSMSNPNAGEQPKHMSEYQNLPNSEQGDYGGVHVNSGIPNRAAWLIGSQVGRTELGRIWYRVLAQRYLNQRSQFLDLRRAAIRACGELNLGATCTNVGSAFDQVGLLDASGGTGGGCPANSHAEGNYCVCNDGYRPNAAGTTCERIPGVTCPPNSHQVGDACYCNDGYVVNAAGTGCEPERSGACPPHSHREGTRCVCDAGYQGSPSSDYGCQPVAIECPPNSQPGEGEDADTCFCLPGWVVNGDRTGCEPGRSGCGNETYFGRCDNDVLVYCNANQIELIDCTEEGAECELVDAVTGNDCVERADDCGGLTYAGECTGTVARWCESGALRERDCGSRGCLWIDAETGYGCNPCPENATLTDGPRGRVCTCVTGYEPTSDGRCLRATTEDPDAGTPPIDEPDAGEPDAGESSDAGTSGGSSSRRNAPAGCATGPASALLLPLVLVLRRRARAQREVSPIR